MGRDTDIDTLENKLAEPNASLDALRDREAGYRTLFMTMGQGCSLLELVRDAQDRAVDMLFIELNPAAERLVGVAAADLVGKRLREAFPDTESVWWETYDTVARSGKPTSLEHYFAPTGRWYESFVYPAGGDRVFVMYEDTTVRKQAETALRESERRQAFLLELSDVLRPLSDPVEVQTAALRVLGEHVGAVRAQYFEVEPDGEYAHSEGGYAKEGPRVSGRVRLVDFGVHVIEALAAVSTVVMSDVTTDPLANEEMHAAYDAVGVRAYITVPLVKGGRLVALLTVHDTAARDWTSREIALIEETAERTWAAVQRASGEGHRQMLIDELNHRVKNTLAIVQGLAQQTFRPGGDPEAARSAFNLRLVALASAHDILTRENWASADLTELVHAALAVHAGHDARTVVEGPPMRLRPQTAVSITLGLHELATNAVKYGALSIDAGSVEIRWTHVEDNLCLIWSERDGPPVEPPTHRGFGTRLIERVFATELKAKVAMDFPPEGLVCRIDARVPPSG